MNKIFFPFFLLIAVAGCATRYDLTLSNGSVITAKGRPHLNPDKTVWLYTDASGQPAGVPAGKVTEVSPASMQNDSPTKFNFQSK